MTDDQTAHRQGDEAHAHHHAHHGHGHAHHPAPGADANLVKDPVCGMMVDPHTAKHRAQHAGRTYYFCSEGCRSKFEADPARYIDPATSPAKAEPVPEVLP